MNNRVEKCEWGSHGKMQQVISTSMQVRETAVFARRDLIHQRICEPAATQCGERGKGLRVLHVNNRQPIA